MTMEKLPAQQADVEEDDGVMICEDYLMKDDSDDAPKAEPLIFNDLCFMARASQLNFKQQARQLVINVTDYFRKERLNNAPLSPLDDVLERTSKALKLKPQVVLRLCRRNNFLTYCGNETSSKLHPLRVDAIKNFVEMYYKTDANASISKVYEKLVRSGLFCGSATTLRRILQNEGFDFVRGKRRCEAFTKMKYEFIFEDYLDEKEKRKKDAPPEIEPVDSTEFERVDLEFFRAIMPSIAKLSDAEKFDFRLAVMNKIKELMKERSPATAEVPKDDADNSSNCPNGVADETGDISEEPSAASQ